VSATLSVVLSQPVASDGVLTARQPGASPCSAAEPEECPLRAVTGWIAPHVCAVGACPARPGCAAGDFRMAVSIVLVNESSGVARVSIVRENGTCGTVALPLLLIPAADLASPPAYRTALPGADYVNNLTTVVFYDGVASKNVTLHLIATPNVAEYPDRAVDVVLGTPTGANTPRLTTTSTRFPTARMTRIVIHDPRPPSRLATPGWTSSTPSSFLPPGATGLVEEAQLIVTPEGVVVGRDVCTPISVRTAAALGISTVPMTLWRDPPFTSPAAITFNMTAPAPAAIAPTLTSAGAVPATLSATWLTLTAVFQVGSPNATLAIPIPATAGDLTTPSVATITWVRSDNVAPPAAGSLPPLTMCFVPSAAVPPTVTTSPAPTAMMPGAVAGLAFLALLAVSGTLWAIARRRLRRSPRSLREVWRAVTAPRGLATRGPFSGNDGALVQLKPGVDPTNAFSQWRRSDAGLEGTVEGGPATPGSPDTFVQESPLMVQRGRPTGGDTRAAFGPEATPGSQGVKLKEVRVQPRPAAPAVAAAFVGGGTTVSHFDNPLLMQRKGAGDASAPAASIGSPFRATPPHARGGVLGWFNRARGARDGGLAQTLSRHNSDLAPPTSASPVVARAPVITAAAVAVPGSGELLQNPLWRAASFGGGGSGGVAKPSAFPPSSTATVPTLRLPSRDSDPRSAPSSTATVDIESARNPMFPPGRNVSPTASRKAPTSPGGGGESVASVGTAVSGVGFAGGGGGGRGGLFGAAAALLARTASGERLTARPKLGGR